MSEGSCQIGSQRWGWDVSWQSNGKAGVQLGAQ